MRDMFLMKDDGYGELYTRCAALAFVRVIPQNLRGTGAYVGDVEVQYLSGTRDFITDAEWKRIKPLVLMDMSKDWKAEADRLEDEILQAQIELARADAEIKRLNEVIRQSQNPLRVLKLDKNGFPTITEEDVIEALKGGAQGLDEAIEKALRDDMAQLMQQPADTPPPPHQPLPLDPDTTLVNVVRVERASFYSKTAKKRCPQWRLFTDDGRQVNAFDHSDPLRDHKPLLIAADYLDLFMQMDENDTSIWSTTPIQVEIMTDGQFWKLVSLVKRGAEAGPDDQDEDEEDPLWLTVEQVEVAAESKRLLADKIVVIDAETTGLNRDVDQPIELGVIDAEGNRLFHRLIKPTVDIHDGALAVHKITPEMLANEPYFEELRGEFTQAIEGARVLGYNVAFDLAMLHNVGINVEYSNCIADLYNRWAGKQTKRGGLRKHTLIDACAKMRVKVDDLPAEHSALGDAQRALRLLKAMADYVPADVPEEQPPTPLASDGTQRDEDIPF